MVLDFVLWVRSHIDRRECEAFTAIGSTSVYIVINLVPNLTNKNIRLELVISTVNAIMHQTGGWRID